MSEDDFDPLSDLLDDIHELRGIPAMSPRAKTLFFRALAQYPWRQVEKAIEAHLQDPVEGKFRVAVQPAHVIGQIEGAAANDGRPASDEAWSIALQSQDEAMTVVWNDEIASAFAVARPILERRDETGARMAFRQSYERMVIEARRQRRPVKWMASLGTDPAMRETALTAAVTGGLLPAPHAQLLLPPPANETPTTAEGAAQLAKIKAMLASATSARQAALQRRIEQNEAERERVAEQKAEIDERVRERGAA